MYQIGIIDDVAGQRADIQVAVLDLSLIHI